MNQQTKTQTGFTIIELMLSMTFVSVLLVMIAMTTIQISKIYDRGLTLKTVNQAGRDLSDSFRRDVAVARQSDVKFIAYNQAQSQDLNRLCLGNYSYVWNDSQVLSDGKPVTYRSSTGAEGEAIKLARLSDPGGLFCQEVSSGVYPIIVQDSIATELLGGTDQQLVIHDFNLSVLAQDSSISQAVYNLSFTLGTSDRSVIDTSNQQCKAPTDQESNLEFCAVNKFELAIRASGV